MPPCRLSWSYFPWLSARGWSPCLQASSLRNTIKKYILISIPPPLFKQFFFWGLMQRKKSLNYIPAQIRYSISAIIYAFASSRISLIKIQNLPAISLLDEPLLNLVAYDEEVSLNMRSGMILGKTQVDRAADIDRHLIEAFINQGVARSRYLWKSLLGPVFRSHISMLPILMASAEGLLESPGYSPSSMCSTTKGRVVD